MPSGRRHRAAEHDGRGQVGAGERDLQFGFEDGHGGGAGDVWRLRRMACLVFTISMKAVTFNNAAMDTRKPLDSPAIGLHAGAVCAVGLAASGAQSHGRRHRPHLPHSPALRCRRGAGGLADGGARRELGPARWQLARGSGGGCLFGLEFLLVGEGLRHTSASHMVVFLYTAPIFAALGLHWRLPAERLGAVQWLGIALAFGGISIAFFGRSQPSAAVGPAICCGAIFGPAGRHGLGRHHHGGALLAPVQRAATQTLLYQLVVVWIADGRGVVTAKPRRLPTPAGAGQPAVSFAGGVVCQLLLPVSCRASMVFTVLAIVPDADVRHRIRRFDVGRAH